MEMKPINPNIVPETWGIRAQRVDPRRYTTPPFIHKYCDHFCSHLNFSNLVSSMQAAGFVASEKKNSFRCSTTTIHEG